MLPGLTPCRRDGVRRLPRPPRSALLGDHRGRFQPHGAEQVPLLARISKRLRTEREFAFYGDIDFIPTDEYTADDAAQALDDARTVVEAARRTIAR